VLCYGCVTCQFEIVFKLLFIEKKLPRINDKKIF